MKKIIKLIIIFITISVINSIKINAYEYDPPNNDFDNYVWINFNDCWTDDGITSGWFEINITITVYGDNTLSNGDVLDYVETPGGNEYCFPFNFDTQFQQEDIDITAYYTSPEVPEEYINIECFDCKIDGSSIVSALVGSTISITSDYIDGKEFDYFDIASTYYYDDPLDYVVNINDSVNGWLYITANYTIIDSTAPVISGPIKIIIDLGTTLTINEIKSRLTAQDDVDGNVTSRIYLQSDNYTANKNKLGSYNVVFYCTDIANNFTYHTVQICVVDRNPPVFYVSDLFITIEKLNSLLQSEIVEMLS